MSSSANATASSMTPSATASGTSSSFQLPSSLKVVGIILAITSGALIGSSFVFKKKGLLRSQAGHTAGEGVAYLKSPLWWTGMIMMIVGEICNFAAYAFVEALVVTPMGALSVVVCAILSSIFLKEKLTFFGWLGCALCIIGSVIIALNGPQESTPSEISEFKKLFISPGFLAYTSVLIAIALSIIIYFGPRYGKKHMLWYIVVCSTIGGISVSVTTGLGAAIVTTAMGHNQFNNWFIFFLMGFVVITLVTEVYFLNVALALFNTAMVTPTYYVLFSFCSMVTTIVLYQGLSAPVTQILTLVFAFLTICVGITILQMSKIDPTQLSLDRRSTLLLQAARAQTDSPATYAQGDGDAEKSIISAEGPGMDALRGSFGTFGSIARARRLSQASRGGMSARNAGRGLGVGGGMVGSLDSVPFSALHHADHSFDRLPRHQLYDAPVPSAVSLSNSRSDSGDRASSISSKRSPKITTIKFGPQDLVHSYTSPGSGDGVGTTHSTVRSAAAHLTGGDDLRTGESYIYPPTTVPTVPSLPSPSKSPYSYPQIQGQAQFSQSTVQRMHDHALTPIVTATQFLPGSDIGDGDDGTKTARGIRASDPFETPTTPTPASSDLLSLSPDEATASSPLFGNSARSGGVAVIPGPAVQQPSRDDVRPRRERRSNSTTQSRRYPTRGMDDAEERATLWERPSPTDEEADAQRPSSIRLVQPPRMGERF